MAAIDNNTIGTASRDYATFALWESAEDGNLVTADIIARATVYNDSVFSAGCLLQGWTTSASCYIEILAADGNKHDGTAGTGARINDTSTGALTVAFGIRFSFGRITDMSMNTGNSGNANFYGFNIYDGYVSSPSDIRILYSFIDGNSDSSGHGILCSDSDTILNVRNNIIMNCTSEAGIKIETCATAYIYNNTCYGNDYGILRTAGTVISINNACFDSATANFSGTFDASSGYNASSAADCPGSNNQESKSAANNFVSVGSGTEDFNVKDTSADIYTTATDLSGVANYPFYDDIIDYVRDTWDIGAFEFQAGSSSRALIVAQKLYSIHKFGLINIEAECKIRDLISDFGDKATFKIGNPSTTYSSCIIYNVKRSLINPKRIKISAITGGFLLNEDSAWPEE